jgi:hypothetical protein
MDKQIYDQLAAMQQMEINFGETVSQTVVGKCDGCKKQIILTDPHSVSVDESGKVRYRHVGCEERGAKDNGSTN